MTQFPERVGGQRKNQNGTSKSCLADWQSQLGTIYVSSFLRHAMQQQGANTSHCGVDHEDYQRLDPHACVVLLCCHGPAGSSGPHATKTETLPLIVTSQHWILSRSGKMLTTRPVQAPYPQKWRGLLMAFCTRILRTKAKADREAVQVASRRTLIALELLSWCAPTIQINSRAKDPPIQFLFFALVIAAPVL
jgi:hypothetical protein